LVSDEAGNLYGTTSFGGDIFCGCGTVFKLDLTTGQETALYGFRGYPADGTAPWAGVVRDKTGNLYGATSGGGAYGDGIAFKLDKTGKETVLHTFTGGADGSDSLGALILDGVGNLYGTTFLGGRGCPDGCGVVYRMNKTGNETVLYRFAGPLDGQDPHAGVIRDAAGNLYGTTTNGGAHGWGAVFKLDTTGKETVLHSFTGGSDGGRSRGSGVVRDAAGNLYGTTFSGGTGSCPDRGYGVGCGVVFKVNKAGRESVLHQFTGTDGANPRAGLLRDAAGSLYGTTPNGGVYGFGEVFKIAP
jgi:uncharacterized repeat protein (TIGR03803 family)